MASKREQIRERKEQQARQARTIQLIGAGAIILLVALVIWQSLPKKSGGDQAACAGFADIPVAA